MTMRHLLPSLLAASLLAVACSSSSKDGTSPTSDKNPTDGTGTKPEDEDDPAKQPPHSLGVIVLGEAHAAGNQAKSTPIVSASFVPDARLTRSCATKIEGCEIVEAPKCASKCATGEVCTRDDSCNAVCKKPAVCKQKCDADEVCAVDADGKSSCQKLESFDAGPIAFGGTTTAITLYPPYAWKGDGNGAPFLADAELKVQAQGTTGAGFEKFEETFKATNFIQPVPALNKIPSDKVFGSGPLSVGWVPGKDRIVVTVAGAGGSVTCKADDAAGKYDLPRAAINAALGDAKTAGALSLTIARERKETRKGKTAKGSVAGVSAQPEGWLELVTTSRESNSFMNCGAGKAYCDSSCVDITSDDANCGACDNVCGDGEVCGGGKCASPEAACDACLENAEAGTCAPALAACKADTACATLIQCLGGCQTSACQQNCVKQTPAGQTKLTLYQNCMQSACGKACNF